MPGAFTPGTGQNRREERQRKLVPILSEEKSFTLWREDEGIESADRKGEDWEEQQQKEREREEGRQRQKDRCE